MIGDLNKKAQVQASPSFGNYDPSSGYQDPGTENGDGFGTGDIEIDIETIQCFVEQRKEADVDAAAQEFLDNFLQDIANGSIDSRLEHGALIVNVDGQIYALPRVTGTATMIPLDTFTEGPNGLIANNLSWSNIVGIIHSHTASTANNSLLRRNEDLFNRGPSSGDLASAEFFSFLGGGQDVTSYIISPEGDLLEYEGYEQPDWLNQGFEDDKIESEIENATSQNESDAAGECV